MCKILCFFGFHRFKKTDWVSKPHMISRHKKVRYHLLQCQGCCKIKNGKILNGTIIKGRGNHGAKPLKTCNL